MSISDMLGLSPKSKVLKVLKEFNNGAKEIRKKNLEFNRLKVELYKYHIGRTEISPEEFAKIHAQLKDYIQKQIGEMEEALKVIQETRLLLEKEVEESYIEEWKVYGEAFKIFDNFARFIQEQIVALIQVLKEEQKLLKKEVLDQQKFVATFNRERDIYKKMELAIRTHVNDFKKLREELSKQMKSDQQLNVAFLLGTAVTTFILLTILSGILPMQSLGTPIIGWFTSIIPGLATGGIAHRILDKFLKASHYYKKMEKQLK